MANSTSVASIMCSASERSETGSRRYGPRLRWRGFSQTLVSAVWFRVDCSLPTSLRSRDRDHMHSQLRALRSSAFIRRSFCSASSSSVLSRRYASPRVIRRWKSLASACTPSLGWPCRFPSRDRNRRRKFPSTLLLFHKARAASRNARATRLARAKSSAFRCLKSGDSTSFWGPRWS